MNSFSSTPLLASGLPQSLALASELPQNSNSSSAPDVRPKTSNSALGNPRKRAKPDELEQINEDEDVHSIFGIENRDYINPDIAKQSEDCFDRFLTVRPIDQNQSLTTLSIIKLGNKLQEIGVKPINVTKVKNQLTIQVSQYKETVNLLKCQDILGIPVIVEPHSKLNTSKGVIKCPDIKDCSVEDIVELIPNVIEG